jgi:hypothetical protein
MPLPPAVVIAFEILTSDVTPICVLVATIGRMPDAPLENVAVSGSAIAFS